MGDHNSIRYQSSVMTAASTLNNVRANLLAQKPHITITLKGETEPGQKVPYAFSTRDKIEGEVSVTPQNDVRFDDIYITFEGVVRVWTQSTGPTAGTARSEIRRMFLKMNQPIDESTLPVPRIALKGVKYTFPFSFVVPDQLLDSNCGHIIKNDVVRQAHLHLPPTMGTGKAINQDGTLELDDVTPDMAKIRYGIKVRVTRRREVDGKQAVIAEEQRNLNIVPALPEAPPPMDDNTFVFKKEKEIRKGLFKGKLGRLIVQADPPRPLENKSYDAKHRASTTVSLNLTFIPSGSDESTEPPKLGNVTTKLKYRTFFSTKSINIIPQRKSHLIDPYMGQFQETVTLSSRALNGIKWRKGRSADAEHDSTYGSRRGSDMSDSASTTSVTTESPNHWYAEVLVPVSQPENKALPPTFQSCHVGRQYELDIGLSVEVGSRFNSSFNLKLPVQVTAVGEQDLTAAREAEELPGFEEFFTPRSVAPPQQGLPSFADSLQEIPGQLPSHMMSNSANTAPPPGYGFTPVGRLMMI